MSGSAAWLAWYTLGIALFPAMLILLSRAQCGRCHGSGTIWDGQHLIRCPDCTGTGQK